MPALAATATATATLTPENLLTAALNALLRLVTDPEVAHETARRAADSLIRYALPKPERTPLPQPSRERELAEQPVRPTHTVAPNRDSTPIHLNPPAAAPPKHSAPSHDPKHAT